MVPSSTQIATQLAQALAKGLMGGLWMSVVFAFQLILACWPALLILIALIAIRYRLRN